MLCVWALVPLYLVHEQAQAQDLLPPSVLEALQQAGVPAQALGAAALPIHRGGRVWQHNASTPMQPASTMKVLTVVVGLDGIGANHRGRTELFSTGTISNGVLQGDLYLRGGADPEFDLPKLWQLLFTLREQHGVREITGRLVQDRSYFNPTRFDLGLPPFDEWPEFPYNGIPDAIHLDANLLRIQFESDASSLKVRTVPALPGISVSHGMRLSDTPCADWDDDWAPAQVTLTAEGASIELQGAFPKNCRQQPGLMLLDRVLLTDRLVRAVWQQMGGRIAGGSAQAPTPPGATRRAQVLGQPWAEVARGMNKSSDNPITRLLYLSLGAEALKREAGRSGSTNTPTLAAAQREVHAWFSKHGIDATGLVLDNGSGLSRSERIAPMQMAQLLKIAHASMNSADVLAGLPIAGVDGTLRNRFKSGPAFQRARLKTGTLRNVVALAGYVPDAQGRQWAVAVTVNHDNAPKARPVLDAFINWVAGGGTDARWAPADPALNAP
jgi:serine-type D-Ala-D-Ala carboxypeptidase/endopeptidase (penicillin-binding protein 4)